MREIEKIKILIQDRNTIFQTMSPLQYEAYGETYPPE